MTALTARQLFKYDWRVEIFLRKYTGGEPFEFSDGRKRKLVMNKAIVDAVKRGDEATINKIGLLAEDGTPFAFGKLEKTSEFGGRGAGAGTLKEDIELARLQSQIDAIKVETASATVSITVGTKTYKVAGAASTPSKPTAPKSDFHLLDNDGKEVVWISHKDGRNAKDFQQWGGLTEAPILRHAEVKSFTQDVYDMFDGVIPRATTVARKIKSRNLKNMSVYGVDYGKALGRQNVSMLIQGPVKLVKAGRSYKFESNHIHLNGDEIDGLFEPVLMAIYKGDRNQFNVKGARFVISPIGGRKITEMV